MKTNRKQFETIALCMALMLSINFYGQKELKNRNDFIRVYSTNGKKIAKGRTIFMRDSVLGLKKGDKFVALDIEDIGYLKTKRSAGHNILVGSLVGGSLLALIGGVTSDEEIKTVNIMIFGEYTYTTGTSPGTGALIGGGIGLAGGAAIGGITSAFKNSETFIIDGDMAKWRIFKDMMETARYR